METFFFKKKVGLKERTEKQNENIERGGVQRGLVQLHHIAMSAQKSCKTKRKSTAGRGKHLSTSTLCACSYTDRVCIRLDIPHHTN
jgi:hypothetical protein